MRAFSSTSITVGWGREEIGISCQSTAHIVKLSGLQQAGRCPLGLSAGTHLLFTARFMLFTDQEAPAVGSSGQRGSSQSAAPALERPPPHACAHRQGSSAGSLLTAAAEHEFLCDL